MKIATSDQSNLILTIADVLKSARILASGRVAFRDTRGLHDMVRERIGGELDDKIGEICGDLGLLDYLRFQLSREILAAGGVRKPSPLNLLPAYVDSIETAKRLVLGISALPHKLRICSPLPKSLSRVLFAGIEDVDIGSGTRIVHARKLHEKMSLDFASEALKKAILRKADIAVIPKDKCHFICTWHSGFVGNFFGNHSVQEHLDKVRALHGCLLAAGVMEEDGFFDSLPQHAVIVHDVGTVEDGVLVYTDTADSDLNYYYENFDASFDYYGSPSSDDAGEDDEGGAVSRGSETLTDDEQLKQADALSAIKIAFGKNDYSRRLFTACLWLFRSNVSNRLLDVILESTIALEVLLGDREASEGLGLTNLLANRCAFLLGKTADERGALINEFKSIYAIRSQIVHSGLHKMDRKVQEASLNARDLARRIIQRELGLAD